MDTYQQNNQTPTLLTLQEASKKLGVGADILLRWNESHILVPKITLNGTIGYTRDQIEEFIRIRQSLQFTQSPAVAEITLPTPQPVAPPPATLQAKPFTDKKPNQRKTLNSIIFLSTFVGGFLVMVVFLSQQSTISAFLTSMQSSSQDSQQTIASSETAAPTGLAITSSQLTTSDDKLRPQNPGALSRAMYPTPTPSNLPAGKNFAINDKPQTATNLSDQAAAVSVLATKTNSSNSTQSNKLLDNNNDIAGSTHGNVLASVMGAGIANNADSPQGISTNFHGQLIFLSIMGGAAFFVLLRKQKKVIHAPAAPVFVSPAERIIEVNQKMDGTVYLTVMGNEYKISKPELYSDSDRFFEHLLHLMQPGTKEIEYNSSADNTIDLSTPLSRLVTRLGFVGIKRDLFFPRTSKNQVLFRRYLTRDDLSAMHMTAGEIISRLANFS